MRKIKQLNFRISNSTFNKFQKTIFKRNRNYTSFKTDVSYFEFLVEKDALEIKNEEPFEDKVIASLTDIESSIKTIFYRDSYDSFKNLNKNFDILLELLLHTLALQNETCGIDDLEAPLDERRIGMDNAVSILNSIKEKFE